MMNFIDYHILSKEYRKEGDVDKLKNLIKDFKEIKKEYNNSLSRSIFDDLAYENMLVFLQVQLFRTQKKVYINHLKQNLGFQEIFKEFNELSFFYEETIEKTKERRDYKIILDYFVAIKDTLQFIYKNNLTTVFSNEIFIILKKNRNDFIINVDRFNKYMEWSKRKNNIHIYVPYKQCVKYVRIPKEKLQQVQDKHNQEPIGLFIDSSYVVPLDYEYDQNKFKWITEEIKNLLTSIHLLISENSQNDIEKKTEAIVKKSHINHIQILGIFAALMAFVIAAATTFAHIEQPQPKIISFIFITFIFGFAVFLLLLRISLEKDIAVFFVSILLIITLFLITSVIYSEFLLQN